MKKETNLEHYKEELKDIFKNNYCYPINMIFRIEYELDRDIKYNETGNNQFTDDILDWMAQPYEAPILDDVEKSYLRSVIKPFRGRVNYIYKTSCGEKAYFIRIVVRSTILPRGLDSMFFPVFAKDTMYKGMELNKAYTLKELGL